LQFKTNEFPTRLNFSRLGRVFGQFFETDLVFGLRPNSYVESKGKTDLLSLAKFIQIRPKAELSLF